MKFGIPRSLSTRITIGFMVLILTFAGILLATVHNIEVVNRGIRVTYGYLQLALVSGDLDSKQLGLQRYLREKIAEEDSEGWARKRFKRLLDERDVLLNKLESILKDVGSSKGIRSTQFSRTKVKVERIRNLVDASRGNYHLLLDQPPVQSQQDSSLSSAAEDVFKLLKKQLRTELKIGQLSNGLKSKETNLVLQYSDKIDAVSQKTQAYTFGFGAFAILVGVLMMFGARMMLKPLQRLRDAAGRIASGDYEHRIAEEGPREVSDLAKEFNIMGKAIKERSIELVRTERLATAGKMAAMITHEVRNPLSSIALNTELIEEELAALPSVRAKEAQELCRSITREIDRLTDITEEYLQLARMPKPKLQPESLAMVVRSVVDFVRDQLQSLGVSIVLKLPEKEESLLLDEGQIRQALLNLIRNATDAVSGQEDAVVTLRVEHTELGTDLFVSDNGPGIPDEIMGSIFEAFVSSKSSGTGLGLALTQQIVGDHGGCIKVHNGNPVGAIFQIHFPNSFSNSSN